MKLFRLLPTLLFILFGSATFAQVKVTGTIVDAENTPIVGATILLENSENNLEN